MPPKTKVASSLKAGAGKSGVAAKPVARTAGKQQVIVSIGMPPL